MTWFVTSANETEAAKEQYHLFIAVDFDFVGSHLRLWTGTGTLQIGGNNYTGAGDLARIQFNPERSNLTVERKVYQLSGVDPALISESDIDSSFGRPVTEYFGFLNHETQALLATPEINFEGEVSGISRKDGAEPLIECSAEHRLVLLDRTDEWRFTHEHQQQFYPGANDLGLNQMKSLGLNEVLWGGFRVQAGTIGGRGGPREGQRLL